MLPVVLYPKFTRQTSINRNYIYIFSRIHHTSRNFAPLSWELFIWTVLVIKRNNTFLYWQKSSFPDLNSTICYFMKLNCQKHVSIKRLKIKHYRLNTNFTFKVVSMYKRPERLSTNPAACEIQWPDSRF